MKLEQVPAQATMVAGQHNEAARRLHGHWLVLARMLWIAIFILTLVVFCGNLMVGNYGLLMTILLVVNISVWFAVGLVLFWRKSSERAILLISLALVLAPGYLIQPYPGALWTYGAWWVPVDVLAYLTGTSLIFWYTFPDGRFVPGFTRWLAFGWIAVSLVPVPIPGRVYPWNWWLSPLYALVRIAFYGSIALALLYRYRWVSTPVQRQQIKWVVFAMTIFIGWVMVVEVAVYVIPSYLSVLGFVTQLYYLIATRAIYFLFALVPLSIGIALLRYQLWDIDIIINRTLVYGSLTALLALIYFGFIIGLESLVRLFTGQASQSPVIIIASTLGIYALFQPLRQRIQRLVDRRFYRSKYDAAKIVEAFSATLRNEVDLTQLSEQVLAVVQETMQPVHVSLWLRPPEHDGTQRSPWRATPPGSSEER